MKLSVFFLYCLRLAEQKGISVKDALKYVRLLGYEGIDIDKNELIEYPFAVEYINECGLKICNVYGEYDVVGGLDKNVNDLVDYAVTCGAKNAMVLTGLFSKDTFNKSLINNREKMLEFLDDNEDALRVANTLKESVDYATKKGVSLTVEDVGSHYAITSYISQIEWLFNKVDGLKFTFDTGNFYLNGQDVLSAFELFGDKTTHVHCKDFLLKPEVNSSDFSYAKISTAIGMGACPISKLVSFFIEKGYDGFFTTEYLGVENVENILIESSNYFKSLR